MLLIGIEQVVVYNFLILHHLLSYLDFFDKLVIVFSYPSTPAADVVTASLAFFFFAVRSLGERGIDIQSDETAPALNCSIGIGMKQGVIMDPWDFSSRPSRFCSWSLVFFSSVSIVFLFFSLFLWILKTLAVLLSSVALPLSFSVSVSGPGTG